MRNALRAIVILGVLWVLDAVVFVPVFATAQAVKPTNKGACCIPGNPPTCGQLTQDNCTKHAGLSWTANASCAHNPCLGSSTTSTTTASSTPSTTTSSSTSTSTSAPVTTSTTSTSSTTTTTCPTGLSLKYTTAAGTTACGGAGFSTPAGAPFSGEIDNTTACSGGVTKINDLGASFLYIGGGTASTVPPGATPAGASSYLDIAPSCALVASNGTGKLDCTKGSSTTAKECVNAGKCVGGASPGATCINDSDCFGPGTCTAGGNGTCTAGVCSVDGVTPCLSNADCGLCQDGISPCTTAADCPPVGACSGPNPHKTCLTDA